MKTLDEVIRAAHHCGLLSSFDDDYEYDGGCPYADCSACEEKRMLGKDIIKYLNEYKRISTKFEKIALGNITETLEKLDNPALTWDELKTMEGKPVWVEYISCKRKVWAIIDGFYTDAFGKVNMNVTLLHDYWNLEKELIGKTWQAYRKERNEDA